MSCWLIIFGASATVSADMQRGVGCVSAASVRRGRVPFTARMLHLEGEGVQVVVIDSGWDCSSRDSRIRDGVGFVGDEPFVAAMSADYHDRIGHGTDCIARILEVAPGVEIHPVRIFGNELDASPEQLVAALAWAGRTGARIVNLSLGTELPDGLSAIYRECERLAGKGVMVVAAGGRGAGWSVPAVFPNVLGVAAGQFASLREYHFDPTGPLEIVADGSTRNSRTGRTRCTTSVATATASGILALLLAAHPRSSVEEARALLMRYRAA